MSVLIRATAIFCSIATVGFVILICVIMIMCYRDERKGKEKKNGRRFDGR